MKKRYVATIGYQRYWIPDDCVADLLRVSSRAEPVNFRKGTYSGPSVFDPKVDVFVTSVDLAEVVTSEDMLLGEIVKLEQTEAQRQVEPQEPDPDDQVPF